MKIMQFMASPQFGGAEKVFVELSNHLAEHFSVTALLLRNTQYANRFSSRVRCVELRSNPTRHNPFLLFEIFSILKSEKVDLIHTHAAKATELIHRINHFTRIPHLGTKHNDRKGRIFNQISWISTVSEKAKASIYPAKEAHIRVIHNGVTEEKVDESNRPEIFTLFAAGRLDAIKGFDLLLEQVAQLEFDFRLLIAGDGPEERCLANRIVSLGLQDKVVLLGFRDDIAQLMANCHLVVLSSHQEGGPKVAIEALFYAPMFIGTPVGAVPEIFPEDVQVAQQQLAEKITDVYHNYHRYQVLFNEVRRVQKEQYLLSRCVEKYIRYYEDILNESSCSSTV